MWKLFFSFFGNINWTSLKISIGINIILAIIIYFLYSGSGTEEQMIIREIEVEVPVQSGEIGLSKYPTPVKSERKVDEELLSKYNALKNQYEKDKLCKELMAVEKSEYRETFKDSTQEVEVYTKVSQGRILEQAIKYEVSPYTLKVRDTFTIKKKNKLLGGIEIGVPLIQPEIGQPLFVAKSTLYLQNKKDNILSLGIDTQKTIWAGYIIKF